MTTIYLIRHAEAEGNLYRRIHGHYDSLITKRGRMQLEALKERFSGITLDAVYSSELNRALTTAASITKNGRNGVIVVPALKEVNMGVWEDKTWGEVERFEPEQLYNFNNNSSIWQVDGAEDYFTLQNRIVAAVTAIAARHDGQTIAIVSHGSALRALFCAVLGVPPEDVARVKHSDNTSVALMRVTPSAMTLEYHGDNSHLTDEISTFAHQKWWRENTTYDSTNLRFVPFNLMEDLPTYLQYRRDAWESIHERSAEGGFAGWVDNAKKSTKAHPRAVSLALIGDTPAGMIELDTKKSEADKIGVIEFFYMTPDKRHNGIAVQLLGQAVSVYRELGREKLRMNVSERNTRTLRFCDKYGFEQTGESTGSGGRHIQFEMNIDLGASQ